MLRRSVVIGLLTAAGSVRAAGTDIAKFFHSGQARVLIVSGRNNHDWRTTTPYLRNLLTSTGRFDVRVTEEPAGMTAETLAPYDVIVLDYDGPRWGSASEKALVDFVRGGKGLVAVHAASYSFSGLEVLGDNHVKTGIHEPAWAEYINMIGGTWTEKEPKTGHAPRHVFEVRVTDGGHPITQGIGDSFQVSDELYHNLNMRPGVHVLATAFDNPKNGGTGKQEPVLWTVAYGKGRVFHTTLGHDVAAMQSRGFALTFTRGVEWAALGGVGAAGVVKQDPVRVLLVTGGHDHETSFYSVFDNQKQLAVTVNPHPHAYNANMINNYDVLVLYDMVQSIEDRQAAALKNFVEGGKGVVVLHHAIVDFATTWPWWYEDVVGGKYFEKAEPGHPASTYLHDQQLTVTAAARHPILNGIPPIQIEDETYKGMWISPKAQVLLRTDHPTSDGPVAWVSPYDKSRVVYIQLGHGRAAHENPMYRRLVNNAILWTAGRLK